MIGQLSDNPGMAKSAQEPIQPDDYLAEVVLTAFGQGELSGLSEILKRISEAVHAYGCIIWEVAPGSNLESEPLKGRLFVLAEWFQDGNVFAEHDMPLVESVEGAVIISQKPENVTNIQQDVRANSNPASRRASDTLNFKTICAVPINFTDSKNTKGVVSLYRNAPDPFTEEEIARIRQMARMIPALYQAIRDRVSQKLIRQVSEVLHEADLRASGKLLLVDEMKRVWDQICSVVAETFQCIETSIFMEDPLEMAGAYRLAGTTWNQWAQMKGTYLARVEEGATGWVLAKKQPVRILNLANFEHDKVIIQREYPKLRWNDSLNIKVSARKALKLNNKFRLPPLSFMAAPIFRDEKVLGVIRCSAARRVPYYFADWDLNLLKLVASQISRFWSNWLFRREIEIEKQAWQSLVNCISQLNSFVQQELQATTPSMQHIFHRTFRVARDVVAGADIMDVRLYDADTQELYFDAVYGAPWKKGNLAEVKARLEQRFPVNDQPPANLLGVQVFHSGQAMGIFNAEREGYKFSTFPETERMIVAPIVVQGKVVGVLDLRGTGSQKFPSHAVKVAELLGQQLGLYYYLTTAIGELHQTEIELQRREKERSQTNEDLAHQLKSPLIQAHARLQAILYEDKINNVRLSPKYLALRGLISKAKRVSMSTGLFAELARESAVRIEPQRLRRLTSDAVLRMLIEAASDNELLIEPYRQIKFRVSRKGFEVLDSYLVYVDPDLLEQAVSCLLDNAGKYSFHNTVVDVSGGLTKGRSFYVSVVNRGMPVKQHEINLCKQRLWRSEQATWTTGEGSGIGLWVVDNIMKAHNGELSITPTTSEGVTQIRLIFPTQK